VNMAGRPLGRPFGGVQSARDTLSDLRVTKQFPGVTALATCPSRSSGVRSRLCGRTAPASTLMKILCGVYPHGTYQGEVVYDGKVLRLGTRSIRQAIEEGIACYRSDPGPKMTSARTSTGKEPRRGRSIDWTSCYSNRQLLKRYKSRSRLSTYRGSRRRPDADDRDRQGALRERQGPDTRRADVRPVCSRVDQLMEILRELKSQGYLNLHFPQAGGVLPHHRYRSVLRDWKLVTTRPPKDLTLEKLVGLIVVAR